MGRAGDVFNRPWRGLSAARQQWLQGRHDRHGFESRASYQARWLAHAPLCGHQPMPIQYRPDNLAERTLGPESSARHIGLLRRRPVVQRQRTRCASPPALGALVTLEAIRLSVRRRFVRMLMRRPGENTAARYQRQYRDTNQRKRNIRKRHGVPPSMHRLFQTSHAFRHFAARVDIGSGPYMSAGMVAEAHAGSKATKHRDCH